MRILYQGEMYSIQTVGGINRYFDNVISRLPDSTTPLLTSVRPRKGHLEITHPRLRVFRLRRFKPGRLFSRVERLHVKVIERLLKPDIFHPTYYSFLTGDRNWPSCPVVLTVYDMIHELLPNLSEPNGLTARAKREIIPKADAIICISENTRKDLMSLFPLLDAKRVFVIPLAGNLALPTTTSDTAPPRSPYFVFVGSRGAYKNFPRLLEAFSRLVMRYKDVVLQVVGSAFIEKEVEQIEDLKISRNVLNIGHISDGDLARLYEGSMALIYPSLYEGFGIPILEAMACKTAVVASNTSSIPEVAGDAALFFDPYSADDIFLKLVQILEDPALRNDLILKGSTRAANYSWERTAVQTMRVYRQMVR